MVGEEEHSIEDMQAIEEEMEEMKEDTMEDDAELSKEMQEAYGYPTPDPKYNQHVFLSRAAFESDDTVRTTFLSREEIGKPLFSVRFMLDLYKMALYDGLDKIAVYWKEKVQNITNSGMSNEGFAMNLNVTQKRDMVRKKIRGDPSNLKKGRGVKQYGT